MSRQRPGAQGRPSEQKAAGGHGRPEVLESLWRPAVVVVLSALAAEVLAVTVLSFFPSLSPAQRVVAHGILVVTFVAPPLYLSLLRPAASQIERCWRAEESLRQSEERLRTLADFAHDWEYWIGPDEEYVYSSPSCQRITGYGPEDFQQDRRLLQKITHPDDRAAVEAHFREERQDGETHALDFRILTRDGDERWISHVCQHVHDADGTWLGWRGSNRDVTARKRAEQARERLLRRVERDRRRIEELAGALRIQRDRLQTIMESTHAQLAYLDNEFNFVDVNSAYAEGAGHSQEGLIGKNHFELFPDEENQAIFERARATGEPVSFQARPFDYPDRPELGTTYWDWTLVPVKDKEEVQGLVLSLLDVTERERLMQALAEERARLAAVITNAPEGIVVVDDEARIVLANPATEEIYGREPPHGEPYQSHGDLCLCHPDGTAYRPRDLPLTRSALDGETHTAVEMALIRPGGESRALLVVSAPIRDKKGAVTGAVGVFRDITERKRIEETVRLYADRLRVLREIDKAILAARGAEEIADNALPLLRELVPCRRASVEVFELEAGVSRLLAVDADGGTRLAPGRRVPLAWSRSLETLRRGDVHIVEDIVSLEPSPLAAALREEEIHSYVSVPLRAGGELIGSVNLGRGREGGLENEHIDIVREVATQVAVGLRQAQLHREVQSHAEELEERVLVRTEELRESEARFRAIFEQAALGIALLDGRGRLTATNPALQEMLGEPNEALLGRGFAELVHPEAETGVWEETLRRIQEGIWDPHWAEMRYVGRDGDLRWATVVLSLVRDARGEPEFAIALIEDTTRRKEAQAELRRSERRQALALQAVGGGIYEHPIPLDETTHHSEGWAEVLGFRKSELPPYDQFRAWLYDRIHPDDRGRWQTAQASFAAGESESYRVEIRMRHVSGRWVWVEDVAEAVERDEDGRVTRVIGLMRDITEQKEAQAALMQSERLATTGELAASLAHEINNPLQAVIGCLGLADESLAAGEDDDFQEYVSIALEELRRAARVVSRLRDLSRPTNVKGARPTDVNALIDRVIKLTRKKLKSEGIRVGRRLADDLPQPNLVADRVHQIFLNLVLNAIDAMPDGGELTIITRYDEGAEEVVAAFRDGGTGIPEELLPQLFRPFFSTKSQGTGLGLFVSQNIAQEHGGRIEVESREGKGCTFTVHLPVTGVDG
ncbi:MAG: PAS domain S-box protein [Chloroflexota bacterium]